MTKLVTVISVFVLIGNSAQASQTYSAGSVAISQNSSLAIASGLFLRLENTGNLVLYQGTSALWTSGAPVNSCSSGCVAVFQKDGNLAIYNGSSPIWSSGTHTGSATTLTLSSQLPQVRITSGGGSIEWSNNYQYSAGALVLPQNASVTFGSAELTMQSDGNLVLYQNGSALWSTNTHTTGCGQSGCIAVFQTDGNFVVYKNGSAIWSSNTAIGSGATLVLSPEAPYVKILNSSNQAVWSEPNFVGSAGGHGGSNYICVFASGNNCIGAIASYHANASNPANVANDLQTMYANGQRRLRIPIFFWAQNDDGTTMNASGGDLPAQDKQNLADLLSAVKNIGFEEVEIAFFPFGQLIYPTISVSSGGASWDESKYQVIWNVIARLHATLVNSKLRYLTDLTNEAVPSPYAQYWTLQLQYCQRLWIDYASTFGTNDTLGFSLVPEEPRVKEVAAVYQGTYPAVLDIHFYADSPGVPDSSGYGPLAARLPGVRNDLAAEGLGSVAWIIGESTFNNASEAATIQRFVQSSGQSIRYLCQWPPNWNSATGWSANSQTVQFSNYVSYGL